MEAEKRWGSLPTFVTDFIMMMMMNGWTNKRLNKQTNERTDLEVEFFHNLLDHNLLEIHHILVR